MVSHNFENHAHETTLNDSSCCNASHEEHEHQETANKINCCSTQIDEEKVSSSDIPNGYRQDILYIKEMDCPMESKLIEKALAKQDNIYELRFNYLKREVYVIHKGNITNFIPKIKALNMSPILKNERGPLNTPRSFYEKYETPRLIIAGLSAVISETIHFMDWHPALSALFAFITIGLVGLTTYKKGWIAIKNRTLNINALMSVAVTGAILLGIFPEAAMVIFLFTLSELIEAKSLTKAQNAVEKLLKLTPDSAKVLTDEQKPVEKNIEDIQIDEIIRIMPGERLPLDGIIIRGHSNFDEAAITGESLPVDKSVEEAVYAGSINQQSEIDYRVTSTANNSTIAKIIRTIEAAQVKKAPVQRFIDKFAAVYTPIVFIVAILIALLSPIVGVSWFDSIYKALVILIIACPCALVISTPVAVVSALTQLARHGVLVKGGEFIEKGAHLTHIAFDKTGTLTEGKPQLNEAWFVTNDVVSAEKELITEQYALSLANRSDHPISKAIVESYNGELLDVENFTAIPGQGTQGTIGTHVLLLGNPLLMHNNGISLEMINDKLTEIERIGASLSIFALDGEVRAIFAVTDPVKTNAAEIIQELKSRGIISMLLSGDHAGAVHHVAGQIGIDEVHATLMPEGKLAILNSHQEHHAQVGMIGDGINDAPSLAQADVGFAMAAIGSDIAIETADVALMDDNLAKIPYFIEVSQKTLRLIKQNIVIALGIKAIFFIAIFLGHESMWAAVFADVGASLVVIFNSLRILKLDATK